MNRRTKKKLFDIFLTITLHPVKVLVIAAITGKTLNQIDLAVKHTSAPEITSRNSRWPRQSATPIRPTRQTWPCPPLTADSSCTTRPCLQSRVSSSRHLTSLPPPARASHGDPQGKWGHGMHLGRSKEPQEKSRPDIVYFRLYFPQRHSPHLQVAEEKKLFVRKFRKTERVHAGIWRQ